MSKMIAILEPFCFFQSSEDEVVFINELQGTVLSFDCNVLQSIKPGDNTAFYIDDENTNKDLLKILLDLEEKHFLSIYPLTSFSKSVFRDNMPLMFDQNLLNSTLNSEELISQMGKAVRIVSIYPDGVECPSEFKYLWKQFFAPYNSSSNDKLDLSVLASFIKSLPYTDHTYFYVCSSNPSITLDTVTHLKSAGVLGNKIIVRTFLSDKSDAFNSCLQKEVKLEFLANPSQKFSDSTAIDSSMIRLVIRDESEYRRLISNNKLKSLKWIPAAKKTNDFFYETFKITREDIHNQKHTINNIKLKKELNTSLFGILHIFPDGSVWDSPNGNIVGSIYSDSPIAVLKSCLENGSAWTQTRDKISPCCNCAYCNLCPSVSEYERYLETTALCIKNDYDIKKRNSFNAS
jgi:pseudo-rSAM protein